MRGRVPLLFVGFWILPALVSVAGFQVVPSARNPTISLAALTVSQLLVWLAWALWSLLVIAVSERVPFERGRRGRAVLLHVTMAAVVVTAQILVTTHVWAAFNLNPPRGLGSMLAIGFRTYGDLYVVIYFAIVGANAAFRWHAAWQAQAVHAARLERDLSAAQLTTLRSQLNPHFLFNALNSVVTLIPRDQDGAARMVIRLASLLRGTLGMAEEPEVVLERELELTRNYLEIELVRFADRLTVAWEIDERARGALVPAFALQPLVENALVHGIARRRDGGHIVVGARVVAGRLRMWVSDDGPGPRVPAARAAGNGSIRNGDSGIGLANLRARVRRLYDGHRADVTLTREDGRTIAAIDLPFTAASPPPWDAPDSATVPSLPHAAAPSRVPETTPAR